MGPDLARYFAAYIGGLILMAFVAGGIVSWLGYAAIMFLIHHLRFV